MVSIMTNNKYLYFILLFLILIPIYLYLPFKPELLGNYNKVWAHRVNSKEKLLSALNYYEDVELDLVYIQEEGLLDVNHPPAQSSNLSFKNYLLALPDKQRPFLWLDIKNLSKYNSELILNRLIENLIPYDYPLDKILVESTNANSLPLFSNVGFKTSYYLPYGLVNMSEEKLKAELIKIKEILHVYPKVGISTNIQDYEILVKNFPQKTKYLWSLGKAYYYNFLLTRKALKDPNVKIVLTDFRSL